MEKRKRKVILTRDLRNLSDSEIKDFLEKEIFASNHFLSHVKEVSYKTNIDEEIVKDVLRSYFTNIHLVINTVRKIKTKINIYGYFSLFIHKGKRI